jgi:hypothetical protein
MARSPKPSAKKSTVARPFATTMRFDPIIKEALERAAKEDRRTATSLTMKILEDWLKAKGFLK